jgi:hypothetical protein
MFGFLEQERRLHYLAFGSFGIISGRLMLGLKEHIGTYADSQGR